MKILLFVLLSAVVSFGQSDTAVSQPYRTYTYELVGAPLLIGASYVGFRQLDRVASFTVDDLKNLDPNRINAFDRPAIYGHPGQFDDAQKKSDLFLNISIASPLLLMLDKSIRKDWLDLLTLYMVTHAGNNLIYFAAAFPIRRARPLTYNSAVSQDLKIGQAKSNSFYSGHVSFSTTATFFLAKVLTDYHDVKGWKRVGIFTVASVPPILVGLNRIKAGKHFRTDVLTGFAVGAACGILIPELHKNSRKNPQLTLQPYFVPFGQRGLSLTHVF